MGTRFRTITAWVLLGLFGAIALAGQGLHLIPGLGHGHGNRRSDERLGATDAGPRQARHQGDHRGCGTGGHHQPVEPPASLHTRPSAGVAVGDGHRCPICRFFATSKPLLGALVWAESSRSVAPVSVAQVPASPVRFAAVYRGRAPPRQPVQDVLTG